MTFAIIILNDIFPFDTKNQNNHLMSSQRVMLNVTICIIVHLKNNFTYVDEEHHIGNQLCDTFRPLGISFMPSTNTNSARDTNYCKQCSVFSPTRYVGVIWFVFTFPNFYKLDLHNKTHVAYANL